MICRSIYVVENGITLFYYFLWLSNIPMCVCVCVCVCIIPHLFFFLVERKVCFISDASSWWGEGSGHQAKSWFPSSPHLPLQLVGQESFYRPKSGWGGAYIWTQRSQLSQFSSVQFSRSVVSDSFRPHELQHARPPCPSPTPGVYWNSCPSSRWCHPAISSSVVPFSSCPQSLPASGSFPMSQLSASGGHSIGVSASASALPMNTQDWSPLGGTGWISLQSKGLSRVFSNTTVQKHQFFGTQFSSQSNSHIHTWPLEKP